MKRRSKPSAPGDEPAPAAPPPTAASSISSRADYEKEHFAAFLGDGWKAEWDSTTGLLRELVVTHWDGEGLIRALHAAPAARLLERLELDTYLAKAPRGSSPTDPMIALADAPFPESLRSLSLALHDNQPLYEQGDQEEELDAPSTRDCSRLWAHIPFVRDLDLVTPGNLDRMDLPLLERLRLNCPGRLPIGKMPKLTELVINDNQWGIEQYDLPSLKRLKLETVGGGLGDLTFTNERYRFKNLAKSPLLKRIEVLDMSKSVNAKNVKCFAEIAAKLKKLREVHVGATCPELAVLGDRVKVVA